MDEISRIRSVFGKFRYQRLSALGKRLLEQSLAEQKRITNRPWSVFQSMGCTEAVPNSAFTLVLANISPWKPARREVIVLDEQNEKFLLPYRNVEDFFAFASLLALETLWGYATLAFFIQPTCYDFERLSPPQQIRNEADADMCEFEFLEEYRSYTEGVNSLWWGSNAVGSFLFTMALDLHRAPPFMKFTWID